MSNVPLKVAVIGGGAAGFFAAIHAAEGGCNVKLFEKGNKLLAKVKVSGGGRCNVTNGCSVADLVKNYPRGEKELRGPFTRFNNEDTVRWFETRGVNLKTEADGRIFPVTDSSETIIKCLMGEASRAGVKVEMNRSVSSLQRKGELTNLIFNDGKSEVFNSVIIATGGHPNISSYTWLHELGHAIVKPVPSLFTFNIPENPFADLMGISVQDAIVKIPGTKMQQQGPVLFTHWGLSGPAVLRMSAFAARLFHEKNYDIKIAVNFCGSMNEEQIRGEVYRHQKSDAKQLITRYSILNLPSRLWERLCFLSGMENQRWNETGKSQLESLIALLNATTFHVNGKTTFKEEFVTCGGISLKEVNMKTMESKIVSGLFFAGEVLDIDGVTGGFNFQAAWTTGYLAGKAVSESRGK